MAICSYCHKEMMTADTCTWNEWVAYPDGVFLPSSRQHFNEPSGRCHDCNIKHGGLHHPGCDAERCPRCEGQLISCGCLDDEEEEE